MVWRTEFSAAAERDFELIFDYLFETYIGFGEARQEAFVRAADRLRQIRRAGESLAGLPHRGTLRENIAPGLRTVTLQRAIFWFERDESRETVRVLAVFFGGQDHVRHIVARLSDSDESA